jgi:hypothetical protein
VPIRFVLPALSAFILKNGQMPLLKRINTASGISRCQEKMREIKKQPSRTEARILAELGGSAEPGLLINLRDS